MKKIKRELRRAFEFAEVEALPGGHYCLTLPNGRRVYTASTPSCPHWLRNVRADVRRLMRAR